MVRKNVAGAKKSAKVIGFVPTMGALHAGHLALVARARRDCQFVVASIFVNPAQFGPHEDLARYPRRLNIDKKLLKAAGVDLLFCPGVTAMYPRDFSTYVEELRLSAGLCGAKRPDHFKGVCTVVAKLFNIVLPDIAYFGQKDYQQVKVIERMARDLNFNVLIKTVPTVRESDGLAKSSRNVYLNFSERNQALILNRVMLYAGSRIEAGETSVQKIITQMTKIIKTVGARVDYIAICDCRNLSPIKKIKGTVVVLLAVFIGKTRLIDNMIFKAR